jgi:2-dehydro-3-deoxyphosphogluconate aldolase/(4S)-4-hydroxy-2-oxoglutarate aldolase
MTGTGLPHLPGVATVSQILSALEADYTELKFFPTQAKPLRYPSPAKCYPPAGQALSLIYTPQSRQLARNPG